ncbi:sugar ABC transporter ATP-binding protein [Marinibaculum pumilum]|uniref:Sugar ABC transporter ATP-binding protein n=1 Tax=Marinibaculum pumilum TaxID=1766165 RepID=A0ABV7KU77_9PROT
MTKRLEIRNLSKSFSGTRVLKGVSFDLMPGEIHALVGENGCGKSTFIKCLAGVHDPDPGASVTLDGAALTLPLDPARALACGFSFIHQDLGLIPDLTVMDNIALVRGFSTGMGWRIDRRAERLRAAEALAAFGAGIDPEARIADIPQADRTIVAIARAFARSGRQGRVLVLDEPTAALPAADVDRLFDALRRIAAQGVGMIYVSHRLQEILRIADRVTAFRDGVNVGTAPVAGMAEGDLVRMIVGRSLDAIHPPVAARRRPAPLLQVRDLAGRRNRGASFAVGQGEIVGLAGLLASGRSEIARMLFGLQPPAGGEIRFYGHTVAIRGPGEALGLGIGLVPEDRLTLGGFREMSVAANISLPDLAPFWRRLRLRAGEERRAMQALADRFGVRPRDVGARFGTLSGGNQQKAIIARAMRLEPRLLILDEPVQGVDIGAKAEIHDLVRQAAARGTGILLVDSDFEDLARLCHRVLVLRDGRIAAELSGDALTRRRILECVFAGQPPGAAADGDVAA